MTGSDTKSPAAPRAQGWARTRALAPLLAALFAGAVLRIVLLAYLAPDRLWGDEADYLSRGIVLAQSGKVEGLARAPGYLLFVAATTQLGLEPLLALRIGQIALGVLATALVYALAVRTFGRREALLASWIFALEPTLAAYSLLVFPETLYLVLLLAAVLALLHAWTRDTLASAAAAGALLGVCALVKSVTLLLLLALAAAWFFRERPRRAAARAGSFLLGAACLILPCTWWNHARYGGWVLIDDSAARTLWHANHIEYRPGFDWSITDYRRHYDGTPPPPPGSTPERYSWLLRQELRWLAQNPGLVLARVPSKLGALFNPTSFPQRAMALDHVPALPRGSRAARLASLSLSVAYALLLLFGVLGLAGSGRSQLKTAFWILLVQTIAVHSIMVVLSRYRLPLLPFLAVFAARALLDLRRATDPGRPRTWLALAFFALVLASWPPYLPFVLLERLQSW